MMTLPRLGGPNYEFKQGQKLQNEEIQYRKSWYERESGAACLTIGEKHNV